MPATTIRSAVLDLPAARSGRSRFFLGFSAALLGAVLAAFAPTFYLRPLSGAPPLPWYLAVHGAVLTAWFVLLVVQGALVATLRPALHRRLGMLGAALGVAVAVTGAIVTLRFVPRLSAAGVDVDAALTQLSGIVFGDMGLLASFAVLLTAAVLARHRPSAHKRLIMFASVTLTPPAFARIAQWPVFGGIDQVMFALGGLLLLLVVLAAHDVAQDKRVHRTTWYCLSVILSLAVGGLAAGTSDIARSLVRQLG